MSSALQNIILILGIVLIAGLGYYLYSTRGSVLNTESNGVSQQAAAETAVFLDRLHELQRINLDVSVARDPRLRSLRSNRLPLTPLPIGKPNPFE